MKRLFSLRAIPVAIGVLFLASCNGSSSGGSFLGNLPGPNTPPAFARMFDGQFGKSTIYIFNTPFTTLTPAGTFAKPVSFSSLAFNPANGALAIGNVNTSSVTLYSPPYSSSTTPTVTIAGGASTLNGPIGIAWDGSGDIWVADFNAGKIDEFAPPFSASSAPAATNSTGFSSPFGLAINPVAGLMFVANQGSSTVEVIPAPYTGVPTATLSTGASTHPQAVAVDRLGRLFVGYGGGPKNGKIDVFVPPYATGNAPAFTLTGPPLVTNLAFDPAQNLYDQVDSGDVVVFNGPILGAIAAPSADLGCPPGGCSGWGGLGFGP